MFKWQKMLLYIPPRPHITSLFSYSCLPLIFSPSSLSTPTEEEEEDLSERPTPAPPPRSDSSALCDRGKAGLSRCLYLNTHTRVRACARAHKHTLPAPDPACALSSSPLRAAFFWRSGAANDTQLSVLKTGGGTEGGKKRKRRAESKTNPAAAAELLSVLRSGAFLRGECFLLYFGTFLFPGEERRKKRRGIGVHMT